MTDNARQRLPAAVLLWLGVYLLCCGLSALSLGEQPLWGVLAAALFQAWVCLALLRSLVFVQTVWWHELLLLLAGVVCAYGVNAPESREALLKLGIWERASFTIIRIAVSDLLLLAAAWGAGSLLARGMRKPAYVVLAALAAGLADIISVFAGPTRVIAQSEYVASLVVRWFAPGWGLEYAPAAIGVGDYLFAVVFLVAAVKFSLDADRNAHVLLAAFAVGFAVTVAVQRGLPALPFLGAAFLIANIRRLDIAPDEWRTIARMTAGIAVAGAIVLWKRLRH